jgi:CheY-like chemotaxis protein
VIRVRDTGIGIAPEALPRMFELFAQGDRSIDRSGGGLGIGLTLVRKLAELHGGTVSAWSAGAGAGSEFTVRLPAAAAPTQPPRPHDRAARAEGARARILVVDDHVDTARALAGLLRVAGHAVEVAHDGREAIERARALRPDAVLLDIGLPHLDGYQVARRLRAEGCRDALLIAISGYGQDDDRRRSREAGFDHHLVKPVDSAALVALLGRIQPAPVESP